MMTRTFTILAALLLLLTSIEVRAADLDWDGTTYLRVPVKLGSDTRLVMPEAFDDAWEHDEEVFATLLDAHTLIIRPRTARVEQRLTLRGRATGTLYLARVSSALAYTPVVVVNTRVARSEAEASEAGISVTGLLRAMMLGATPTGFHVERSSRLLFDHPPYRVVAEQLWQSLGQSGIIARVTSTLPNQTVPLVPANILIQIPQLGSLRAMAADDYALGPEQLSSRVYIVYVH